MLPLPLRHCSAHPTWPTLCRPRRDVLVDLFRETDGLYQGDDDLLVVEQIVEGQLTVL